MTAEAQVSAQPAARLCLAPRIRRMKDRLHTADYEICLARARHFTEVYRETEGLDEALRNAYALRRTLERQRIHIDADERLAGSKTERFLSTPLPVERGDFLRALQMELDVLHQKLRPLHMSEADKACFRNEILPYWDGRTLRDRKARHWKEAGIVSIGGGPVERARGLVDAVRWARHIGKENQQRLLGTNRDGPLTPERLRTLHSLRHEIALNNPTPAVYCMDVQGHLCLGIDRVLKHGMDELIRRARERKRRLALEEPGNARGQAFLRAAIVSLEAAIHYAERFAELAEQKAALSDDEAEVARLLKMAEHCRHVPRKPPRTFHEAVQSVWLTQVVGEIQFGTMDVFAVGRPDQYLLSYYERDLAAGRLSEQEALELLQELFLKLSANLSPTPEVGMETNGVLGNSQHGVTVGGLTPEGADGTNALSYLMLEAYDLMLGCVNQVCVRIHTGTPRAFTRRAVEVFRRANGMAFYNDEAVVRGLEADGYTLGDARNYCIVGCVETCGHSDTQGCVAGHDFILPAVLMLALTDGRFPPRALGQGHSCQSGDPAAFRSFEDVLAAFDRQLVFQLNTMVAAVAGKDRAHKELLPAPYVSALIAGCIESAKDITHGGAKYDFTSLDIRGLGTLVDSLMAINQLVFMRREMTLPELLKIVLSNYQGQEVLRQRILHMGPKYGTGNAEADALALRVVARIHEHMSTKRNERGGRFRAAYFSLGNHVIDGFLLGATTDGRVRELPISNGVSPSNLLPAPEGPQAPMRTAAKLPPAHVSSGVALNLRLHPRFIESENGIETFTAMLLAYFELGGMHLQPNVVSTETLREAQQHPERYLDLIVKVSGYSACFTDLGPSIQEDIIARAQY